LKGFHVLGAAKVSNGLQVLGVGTVPPVVVWQLHLGQIGFGFESKSGHAVEKKQFCKF
jgi:hypothetical protein